MSKFQYHPIEADILCIRVGTHGRFSVQDMDEIQQERIKLYKQAHAVLLEIRSAQGYELDAIRFLWREEVKNITTALAVVTTNFLTVYGAKLFLAYHKPPFPAKLFDNSDIALQWLRKFI
ncbi:MAG: hypothetical protein MJA83_09780 [Gammaproteobacteria bacterium]|nr:hypothetical protein [Gammaproteobacteria bacterium]